MIREAIDCHVHPIRSFTTSKSLIKEMDSAQVSKSVLLALDLDPEILNTDKDLREEILYDLFSYSLFMDHYKLLDSMKSILRMGNTSNKHVAKLVNHHPQKFIGFGSVNPSKDSSYVKQKLHEISDLGLQGIKLIPTMQFFHPKKNKNLKSIFKFAHSKDWPILIHLGQDPGPWEIHTLRCVKNSHPKFWVKLIKKFSKNKIIFAHLGGYNVSIEGNWLNEVLKMCQKNPNIYLDTSAVPNHLEVPSVVESIRETCGINRVLFGTDTPVVLGTTMRHSKLIIERNSILSDEEKNMILSENAKKLFHFDE
ncbi:MAG: amidohydrolase family protein [Candidatus Hodarchaeales archaeon]|jgi:predicted TIM-barrel fold metal-dependent hydrolase